MNRTEAIRKTLHAIWRRVRLLSIAAAYWLVMCEMALARGGPKAPADEGKKGESATSWTMAYGLVILGVALGMLFVCRSSRRRDRAKPLVYGEGQQAAQQK